MVPTLVNQSFLSGETISEAGYVSVCDGDEVNIYDGHSGIISVSEESVLKGWWFSHTKLWRIHFRSQVTDLNMNTLYLNDTTVQESTN